MTPDVPFGEWLRICVLDEHFTFRIVGICLGVPARTFELEYYDKSKSKEYHKIGPVTPVQFYNGHVRPHFDVDAKARLGLGWERH